MRLLYRATTLAPLVCAMLLTMSASLNVLAQKTGAVPPKKTQSKPQAKPTPRPAPKPELDAELREAIAKAPSAKDFSNSNSVRLLDIGSVQVKTDGTIVGKYRMTYKLFNERARHLAEVSLPYNSSYQLIKVTSARTIKPNGTIVDVKPTEFRTSSPFQEYLLYDDAVSVGFSMPAIENGCVIDYTWEMVTLPILMPGHFWLYWGFADSTPVGVSRFTLNVQTDKKIQSKVYNDPTLNPTSTKSPDGKTTTYVWERKYLNPIEMEVGMPPMSEVASWMEVTSLSKWDDVSEWFWKLQLPQAKANTGIKNTVAQLTMGKTDNLQKARAIFDWVANQTRYVGLEFGISAYRPHPAVDVYEKRYGDCKDKTNLLITMLDLVGIKAYPVLLMAGEQKTEQRRLPTITAFNHCIAYLELDGKEYWLDPTSETCDFGDIPAADRGAEGLVVQNGKGIFKKIPTYAPQNNGVVVRLNAKLKPDGSADADADVRMFGEPAQTLRATVRSLTPEQRKEMMSSMVQRFSANGVMQSFEVPDGNDKQADFVMKFVMQAPQFAENSDGIMIIPLGGGAGEARTNPYNKPTRKHPIVETDSASTIAETIIQLPEGYQPISMPTDVRLDSGIQQFQRTVRLSPDGKTLTLRSELKLTPGRIMPADYEKVRSYYAELIKLGNQKLVLKK